MIQSWKTCLNGRHLRLLLLLLRSNLYDRNYLLFFSELYSTHTSTSYSPSISDGDGGGRTPNSCVNEDESHRPVENGEIKSETGSEPPTRNHHNHHRHHHHFHHRSKEHKSGGAAGNGNTGSYNCQFCEKTFPRLGYLKKHEQVSLNFISFIFCS